MEPSDKASNSAQKTLHKTKFSIRFSIASILVFLLLFSIGIIISVNYYTMRNILVNSSQMLLKKSTNLMELKLFNFLMPLEDRSRISKQLLKQKIITAHDNKHMRKYLLNIIKDRSRIYSAYIGYSTGDFLIVEKDYETNTIHLKVIKHKHNAIQKDSILDDNGNIKSLKRITTVAYDPRVRPWYKDAAKNRAATWTAIYRFALTPSGKEIHGTSISTPIYDKNGKLHAVFAMDTTVTALSQFMTQIKPTPNTFLFIMDSNNKLLVPSDFKDRLCKQMVCHLETLTIPWVLHSLQVFKKTAGPIFSFHYRGSHYLASYRLIKHLFGTHCLVGIILPFKDIAGPLQLSILLSIAIALIVLIIILFFARILAGKISRPIAALANDAKAIAKLDFTTKDILPSRIKEVIKIRDAFEVMRRGLSAFGKYVPYDLVRNLIKSKEVAHVGGKSRELTIFFSDIEGFTTIAETMPPTELIKYLSEYFETMSKTVHQSEGTIDKYIGDAIMAFWGAPLKDNKQAMHACQAALNSLQKLKELNAQWARNGKPNMRIRIGINTANVVVGNVGAHDRLSYTALGDGVNLASRLESLNKLYGTTILVNESTYQLAKDKFAFRLIDCVAVRGKKEDSTVYELLETESSLKAHLAEYNKMFQQAFAAYQQADWNQAIILFQAIHKQFHKDNVAEIYVKRCQQLKSKQPANWRGVWEIKA